MKVGSVKEIKNNEFRVGLTPHAAKTYADAGHEVYFEAGMGLGSGFSDAEYEEAGAKKCETAKEVWDTVELMIKVKEPLEEEYQYFREGMIIYTYLHLAADRKLTEAMLKAKVKGVAFETLVEKDKTLPLLQPMSQIAGRLSIQQAAKYLEKPFGGSGVVLAGVPGVQKAKVTILGAGNVGTNATKIAVGMGADVTVIDLDLNRLGQLDDIFGSRIQTLYSNPANIAASVKDSDVVVSSILIPGKKADQLIKREHLKSMRDGSIIVDVAIDQGGTTEVSRPTTHDDPIYVEEGVNVYCVANIPGAVPRTATIALSNRTERYGVQIANKGLEGACKANDVFYSAINTYDGKLTNENVAADFGDIDYVDPKTLIK